MEPGLNSIFSDFTPGWREALLALILVLALYMLFEVFRIRRLRRLKGNLEQLPVSHEPALIKDQAAGESGHPVSSDESPEDVMAWSEPPAPLVNEALMLGVESDLTQMREELGALRGELSALREELRHETAQMRASQTVSPLYSDAMQMAVTGYGADMIAERCGISRAEAELVASLVRNREP